MGVIRMRKAFIIRVVTEKHWDAIKFLIFYPPTHKHCVCFFSFNHPTRYDRVKFILLSKRYFSIYLSTESLVYDQRK